MKPVCNAWNDLQGHSRSLEMASFDKWYDFLSVCNTSIDLSYTIFEIIDEEYRDVEIQVTIHPTALRICARSYIHQGYPVAADRRGIAFTYTASSGIQLYVA